MLSAAPDSPLSLDNDNLQQTQDTSTVPQVSETEVDNARPLANSSTTATVTETPVIVLETFDSVVSAHASKRARAEGGDGEDESPPPKKLAGEVETKTEKVEETAPDTTTSTNETPANDSGYNANEVVGLETPSQPSASRPKSKAKKVVANPTRGRACASCKKRKVRQIRSCGASLSSPRDR